MTRRLTLIRWGLYGAAALFLLLVQSQILGRIGIWGVCPIVIPCIAALWATMEPLPHGLLGSLVLGAVCDTLFTAGIPCFYVLVCLLATILSWLTARHLVMPGLRCSALSCIEALLLSGLFSGLTMLHRGMAANAVFSLLLRESVVSLPFALVLIHPVFSRIHRATTP